MNKILKENIKRAKKLQKKGLVYIPDDLEGTVEPNYQLLAAIIENINIGMSRDYYNKMRSDEGKLIYELALSSFNEEELISEQDIEFKEKIIRTYIDVSDPVLICNSYCFTPKFDLLQGIYEKALKQIKDGKFKNYIF